MPSSKMFLILFSNPLPAYNLIPPNDEVVMGVWDSHLLIERCHFALLEGE
jgi:hypothetical protein